MRIEINRKSNAIIISFDTHRESFESASERNRFFHGLYGWEQSVPRNGKTYHYWRSGVLEDVPHVKISDSVFAVEKEHAEKIMEYFDEWEDKIELEMFEVLMEFERLLNKSKTNDKFRL